MERTDSHTWGDFNKQEDSRVGTIQLSIEDLSNDLYLDTHFCEVDEDEEEELDFEP